MNRHIMIVDDDQSFIDVCQEILEDHDYMVSVARNGFEALEQMNEERYDLFLVDINMPKMSGFELTRKIKEIQPLAVVIIVTGNSSIKSAVNAVHYGAFQYLAKPFKASELLEMIAKGLEYGENLFSQIKKSMHEHTERTNNHSEYLTFLGFPAEEIMHLEKICKFKKYLSGDIIYSGEDSARSIFLFDAGTISVWYKNILIDYLGKWDTWGEENILVKRSFPIQLKAETNVRAKIIERNRLLKYFQYREEKYLKKFMINISNCLYFRWQKSIQRITNLQTEIEFL